MHMPKISFKNSVFASVTCVVLAYAVWPLLYNIFGEGAEITKNAVRQSDDIRNECGEVTRFLIVPWELVIDDSDSAGQLKISYWFVCSGSIAKVKASYRHAGNGWITESITAELATGSRALANNNSRSSP